MKIQATLRLLGGTSYHITSKHNTRRECIAEGMARLARVGHANYLRAVQVANR